MKDYKYYGFWNAGKLHGVGVCEHEDGTIYSGKFNSNESDWFGMIIMKNG